MAGKRRHFGESGWRGIMARFAGSGLSVAGFCRREGLTVSSFYRWRDLLGDAPAPRSLPSASRSTAPVADFVDLGALGSSSGLAGFSLRLELGDGLVLQLSRAVTN